MDNGTLFGSITSEELKKDSFFTAEDSTPNVPPIPIYPYLVMTSVSNRCSLCTNYKVLEIKSVTQPLTILLINKQTTEKHLLHIQQFTVMLFF